MSTKCLHGGLILRLATCLMLLILSGGCRGAAVAKSTRAFPTGTGFLKHQITVDGRRHTVFVFVPKNYRADTKYPAILFLHGLFEAGNGSNCLSGGLGPVIAKRPENWPFITVFPQSSGTWRGEHRDRLAMAALDFARRNWSIDEDRVILAGLSFGGLGTWQIGARHRDRFAALVPVSGHRSSDMIEQLVMLPVWAFTFAADPWVSSDSSEEMCSEIKKRGGFALLTEFRGAGHDAWDKAVNESQLVAWMLNQRRLPGAGGPLGTTAVANIE